MPDPDVLRSRLDQIARSLEASGQALALLGLGSVGRELERLDRFSDLDFFVIVEPGHKGRYLDSLDWLETLAPVSFRYRNTPDGYKLLYADGVLCEFAVFEPAELARIPYAPGRVVWRRADAPEGLESPAMPLPDPAQHGREWLLGEILTALYVGLSRYARGERLAGHRLVEQDALRRVIELVSLDSPADGQADAFAPERRLETRLPGLASRLPRFLQGYDRVPHSAAALLQYLESQHDVPIAVSTAIRDLLASMDIAASDS